MSGPLSGIRVIEVADYVFVPSCTALMADWGADVIKVEHHERGDAMRGLRTFHPSGAAPFNITMEGANRGKRSIGINLGDEHGRNLLYDLVRTADVFVTSKLTPTRRRLGIDADDLRAVNPRLIYARGSGRGVRGPGADDGGFDALDFWYRSGISTAAQAPGVDFPPGMPSGAFGDNTSGMYLAGGVALALFHRERTGQGSIVDASLLGSAMWTFSAALAQTSYFGVPTRNHLSGPAPDLPMASTYRTADGRFISLCALQGFKYFPSLCACLGLGHLVEDDRFKDQPSFAANAPALGEILVDAFGQHCFDELIALLQPFDGQWAPVQDSLEVQQDAQVTANGYLSEITTSTGARLRAVRPPVQFDEQAPELGKAPSFNEHGDEVLKELGLDDDRIVELRVTGAIT